VKWFIVIVISVLLLLLAGCNTAKDTAKTGEAGGKNAVGVAEKMKGGTVGATDEDTGEKATDSESGE
jgi:predicted small secreted protein